MPAVQGDITMTGRRPVVQTSTAVVAGMWYNLIAE
jgi:hypothetical protein